MKMIWKHIVNCIILSISMVHHNYYHTHFPYSRQQIAYIEYNVWITMEDSLYARENDIMFILFPELRSKWGNKLHNNTPMST